MATRRHAENTASQALLSAQRMSSSPTQLTPVRVYFLGSGCLGVPILDALRTDSRVELVGIGSQEDKEVGRKKQVTPTAFAQHALKLGYDVERIHSVNTPEFLERLRSRQVELVLVVAFGQLLKRELLELPPRGCLNVHASLLPKYRGACPINAAILNGDAVTGVTFMRMDVGLDTGPVYRTQSLEILPDETTGQLEKRLGALAANHAAEVIWQVARENLPCQPQGPATTPNVRKIAKNDGQIQWSQDASRIVNMVRAYQPWPKAFTFIPVPNGRRRVQVTQAAAEPYLLGEKEIPGTLLPDRKTLRVLCGNGILRIEKLTPEGRTEMSAEEFLRGNPVDAKIVLG